MRMPSRESSELLEPLNDTDRGAAAWWAALVILLVANLPLMICMPLTADPITYDLQAQTALEGGVLYRDVVEPNLPGVVWVHMAVRSALGWSSYALRVFDLIVLAGIIVLLGRIARMASPASDFRRRTPVLALLLCWFYFSMSEWAHCQRDIWLMLPALGAVWLRIGLLRQNLESQLTPRELLFWGGMEGVLWGIAFWIKPFVAVPALAGLIVSFLIMRSRRDWAINFGGVFMGGVLCGVLGSAWLIRTGAWPYFWDMALHWNPEYFDAGRQRWTVARYTSLMRRFLPWSLIHLVAIPVALKTLIPFPRLRQTNPAHATACLLSAIYLGWLIQAHTLQHLFDYAHVPGTLLALGLLAASWPVSRVHWPIANAGLASLVLVALITSPATEPGRLSWWGRCLSEGSTPEVRCALQHVPLPDWRELEPVVGFLKAQDLKDRNVTAYNVFLIHLYPALGLEPSTRFVFPDVHTRIFKNRTDLIARELDDSPQRFVVSSLLENGMHPNDIGSFPPDQSPELPAKFPPEELRYFPYNQKLVFRSGQYVVHEITQPVGQLNTRFSPLDRSGG